ncbi:hypothetical protein ACQKWADRAFT_322210 [Trichoderma austrokoningii]
MDLLLIWPFIGLLAGAPVILELCKPPESSLGAHTRRQSPWKSITNDQLWWMRAALPIYLLHQFEEHGYDFMGRRYAFRSHFCHHLGFENIDECPLTPLVILFVNSTTVWVTALFARTRTNVARSFYGFAFINGLTHVIPSFVDGFAYNPGLVSAWLLFFPGAYFALQLLGGAGRGVAAGIICHVVLMGSMKLAAKGLIAEWALCGVQVLNTALLISF